MTWAPFIRHGERVLTVWILAAAAYSNCFHAALVFDSGPVILEDSRVHAATAANVHAIVTHDYWYDNSASGLYRPLTTLSYLWNYAVLGNGPRPEGYHAVNLALHLIDVALVYALGIAIFGEVLAAWALAALWGVHPLLTEAVTYVVGRADLLAALGVLAGLLAYIRARDSAGGARIAWLAGLAAAQAIGLFAKENAIVLPALILLYEFIFRKPGGWRQSVPVFAALLVSCGAFFYLRGAAHTHLHVVFLENPLIAAGFTASRLGAIQMLGKLALLFLWPVPLAPDYSYNAVPLRMWLAILALIVFLGAAGFAIRRFRAHPAASFFIGFFFVAVAPTANIVFQIGSIGAERFLYLGAIGLAGCAIVAVRAAGARAAWIAVAAVCLLLAFRTHSRNADWQSDESLWTSAVNAYPAAARPHNNLGNAYLKMRGKLPDAMAQFRQALAIYPDYADAHYNLGTALAQSGGRFPEAIAEYRAALEYNPGFVQAHVNLATALAQTPGGVGAAVSELELAVRLAPGMSEAHYDLATLLSSQPGHVLEAIAEYKAALSLNPDSAVAHNNLGSLLSSIPERLSDAIAEYREALRIKPDYPKAHNNLANALAKVPGHLPDAIVEYQAALRSQPDFADAHYNLGIALARTPGRRAEAIAELEAAYKLDRNPDTARAIEWLRAHGN